MGAFILYGEDLAGLPSGAVLVLVPRGPAGRAFLLFLEDQAAEALAVASEGVHGYGLPSLDAL
jgi:hypothetical protein